MKPSYRKLLFLVEVVPELNHCLVCTSVDSVMEVTDISNVGKVLQECVESFHNDSNEN